MRHALAITMLRIDVYKILHENAVDFNDNLLDGSAVGVVAKANNDVFLGKLWDSKRLQARVDASQQIIASRDSLKGFLSEKNTPVLPMLDN